jgi:hypothetical protein
MAHTPNSAPGAVRASNTPPNTIPSNNRLILISLLLDDTILVSQLKDSLYHDKRLTLPVYDIKITT